MTILSTSSSATNPAATEGDVKSFLTNIRDFISDLLGTDSSKKSDVLKQISAPMASSSSKSTSYTVQESDRGKVVVVTGAGGVTLNIQAAATLGDGFLFGVVNNSSGTVTIDPNLGEQINGATSYVMQATETIIVFCDGSKFLLFGKSPASLVSSFNSRTGAVSLTYSDVINVIGYTPSQNTHNHNGVYAPMSAIVGVINNGGGHISFTRADGSSFYILL